MSELNKTLINSLMKGNKQFEGVFGMGAFIEDRPKVSTGSLSLDLLLGGGAATDRLIELYGPPASFKTSFGLLMMKNYVDKFGYDRTPFIIDMERTLLPGFVRGFGLDPDRIFVARPRSAEQTMQLISNILSTGKFGIGLLDSIDALETDEDLNKDYGEGSMMKLPKLMSEAMRDFSKSTVDNNTGLILINQVRTGLSSYQAVETTSGGKAIPYYTSQRIRFSSKGPSKDTKGAITIKANVKKNKLAPLISAELELDFIPGTHVEPISDFLGVAEKFGIIVRNGGYYSIFDSNNELITKEQGKQGLAKWILGDQENKNLLVNMIETKFNLLKGDFIEKHEDEEKENSTD